MNVLHPVVQPSTGVSFVSGASRGIWRIFRDQVHVRVVPAIMLDVLPSVNPFALAFLPRMTAYP
jgi:hypothetical protein